MTRKSPNSAPQQPKQQQQPPLSQLYYQLLQQSVPSNQWDEAMMQRSAQRAAASWQFQLRGYQMSFPEVVGDALYPNPTHDATLAASHDSVTNDPLSQLVIVKQLAVSSVCEHHLLPFFGHCHIAYLPGPYLLGLSKFARIVEMFACRLQLQERLTDQIAQAIAQVTQAQGVGVIITAQHCCMTMRGVQQRESWTTTINRIGILQQPELWQQFTHAVSSYIKTT